MNQDELQVEDRNSKVIDQDELEVEDVNSKATNQDELEAADRNSKSLSGLFVGSLKGGNSAG